METSSSEYEFLTEKRHLCHGRAKLLLIFGISLVPIFSGLDYVVVREHFWQFSFLRLINTFENILLFLILFFCKDLSLRRINFIASLFCCSVALMIAYMCFILGGYSSAYFPGMMLVPIVIGLVMPWQVKYNVFNCIFTYVAYLVIAYTPGFSWHQMMRDSYFLLSTIFMAVVSNYYSERLRVREFQRRRDLKNANERLLFLDQAKTRFFANMTHEFRTPLVSLNAVIQMIEEEMPLDDKFSSLLRSSRIALLGMIENINDLLNKTKTEQDMLQIRWSRLEIVELVRNVIEIFKPLAFKRETRLSFINRLQSSNQEPLSAFFINADRSKLRKILSNLIGNAVKFTQGGEIEVELETNATHLILRISDTGTGIPEHELSAIFEPFTQASNNPLRDVQGTGLGLSIVKDFVTAHHGEISVNSTLDQGSLFTVLLPLGDKYVGQASVDWSDLVEVGSPVFALEAIRSFEEVDWSSFSKHSPERFNILLVEDTPEVLQALAYVLKDEYNLYFAGDGEAGLAQIRKLPPDLIISDIMMPKKDGYALLAEVKKDPELRIIPFILLTAKAELSSKLHGLEGGADEYISKPFNIAEIRTRVKSLLERRRIEEEFIHAKSMIAIGQLVAGIAHELLNPISYAKSSTEMIARFFAAMRQGRISKEEGERRIQASIENAEEGIRRVCDIVAALRSVLRQGSRGFNFYDIHESVESSLKIIHSNYKAHLQIHRQYDLKEKVECKINPMGQVFLNLLANTAEVMQDRPHGNIWITTRRRGENAEIIVRDDGPGISREVQAKMFKPFFTTKDVGQGMGLGLYICWQIVQEHRGQVSVESSPGKGTQFKIEIPLQQPTGGPNGESFHDRIDRRVAEVQYPHR